MPGPGVAVARWKRSMLPHRSSLPSLGREAVMISERGCSPKVEYAGNWGPGGPRKLNFPNVGKRFGPPPSWTASGDRRSELVCSPNDDRSVRGLKPSVVPTRAVIGVRDVPRAVWGNMLTERSHGSA